MPHLRATLAVTSALLAIGGCKGAGDSGAVGNDSAGVRIGATSRSSAASTAQSSLAAAQTQSFDRFWAAFRQAVLAGDKQGIASVTRFPFETRGTSDDDPVKTYDRSSFLGVIDRLLADDAGMAPKPEPMRQYIERTTTLADRNYQPGSSEARVGNFTFERVGGRWLFARAYMDE